MDQDTGDTQTTSNTEDTQAAVSQGFPWVKPTVERIPLNEATNGPIILTPFDGGQGSTS